MKNFLRKISGLSLPAATAATARTVSSLSAIVLSALAALMLFSACKDDKAYISGNLVSLPDGKVRLFSYKHTLSTIDSTVSREGRFTLEQPGMTPDLAFVGFEAFPDLLVPVILDGKMVYISGNLNYKDDITVSGTAANDDLRRYISSIRGIDIMARTIEQELETTEPAEDSVKYMMLVGKRDSLRHAIALSRSDFVNNNPSSIVSAMFLSMSLNDSMNRRQVDSLINRLDSTIVDNAFSRSMRKRLEQLAK